MPSPASAQPPARPTTKNTYIPALTGLRAVAAYMVVLHHFNPFEEGILHEVIHQFRIGVVIFFVLSGFLITLRYKAGVELAGSWFRRYLQNRLARIYPLFFLLSVLSFALIAWRPDLAMMPFWAHESYISKALILVLNFTLLKAYFANIMPLGLATSWSLTVEESFYLSAPFLLVAVRRWGR